MFAAFLTLGMIEMIIVGVFLILFVIGASYDRKGREQFKWWVLIFGFIFIGGATSSLWTFAGLWQALSWSWLIPVGWYALIGLGYSGIEFILAVRKSAKNYKYLWERHLKNTGDFLLSADPADKTKTREVSYSSIYEYAKSVDASDYMKQNANSLSKWFVNNCDSSNSVVGLQLAKNGIDVEPKINRSELAANIGVWTLFFPAYAVSLVLDDLLDKIFEVVADVVANISGRFVRITFSDVFKF